MTRHATLRLCTFLLLVSLSSSASACCLLPFLNPFAWFCGHGCGCGYGYGYGYTGYAATSPWCAPTWGSYGYGGGSYGSYQGWGASAYAPSYPMVGSTADCDCAPTSVSQTDMSGFGMSQSAVTGAAWPAGGVTAQSGAWSPQHQWTPPATAWQPQTPMHSMTAPAAPQTAMSTAPIYGPAWEVPTPAPTAGGYVAGDIRGDHEIPVIPNSYRPMAGPPIQPAGYRPLFSTGYRGPYHQHQGHRPRPRTVRQWYMGVVR